ncbi:MAG TPA: ABC transporter permease [Vicinamibacterales bacterium]|nr:ABC transporter permease [Vicinamibacterales bacterium]
MTLVHLALASLWFYRRTQLAAVAGVACAVAVLAGSLLVGTSVRASLADLAASRTGRTATVVGTEIPFGSTLADRLAVQSDLSDVSIVPLLSLQGVVEHPGSGRRASNVAVYGIDDRFFAFHGVTARAPDSSHVLLSPDLAAELGPEADDVILVRVARPTDVPLDSLHGRKDEVGRTMRLTAGGTLAVDAMGEFSLNPSQGPVRAAFVAVDRLERDLGLSGRANTLLISAGAARSNDGTLDVRNALSAALTLDDLGLSIAPPGDGSPLIVEHDAGLIPDPIVAVVTRVAGARGLLATPVLSWLATRLTIDGRSVPYSLVTALGPDGGGDARLADLLATQTGEAPLVLNDWAARDLGASAGDAIELEFYRWADEGRLVTDRAVFRVAGVVPIAGVAADRRLAPDYPGITDAASFSNWDPPFPIDLRLVRPVDDEYWERYRATPKAFIPLDAGQALWQTRYGQATSIRLRTGSGDVDAPELVADLSADLAREIGPLRAGFNIVNVSAERRAAAVGATDFGQYFSYFSFFLMVSALLLAALFFRLAIEQRLPQVGVLRAIGLPPAAVRRLFLIEGGVIALAGGLAGIAGAVGWAWLMMYGLRTWWSGAVGTSRLVLHVDAISLVAGVAAGGLAALVSIGLTVSQISRLTPRQLLTGSGDALAGVVATRRARQVAALGLGGALTLSALGVSTVMPAAGAFFGAGALVLVGGLAAFKVWLGREQPGSLASGSAGVARLGVRNASWRPGRSLAAAGLVAAAVFLLVSVDSFRKDSDGQTGPHSGTGGFALLAESQLPMVHDPMTAEGRDALGLQYSADDPDMAGVTLLPARLRAGDDTSCLNLYRPQRPRLLGLPAAFLDANRFRFGRTTTETDQTRANPWHLLGPADADGIVPAIIDQTSLQYVLHAAVGDVITIDEDTARPARLRVVAALSDTVLQGEILVAEPAFRELFPDVAGYHVLFVEVASADPARVQEVAAMLEERLEPFGLDAQETTRRLAAFHQVENTYLSTFQTLGGLGLVLGCLGLAAVIARNVLERRRELALLGAAGYTGRDLQTVVLAENVTLISAGLGIGLVAAIVAIGPLLLERAGTPPLLPLIWLVVVGATGLLASMAATRQLRRLPLVPSLRSE